MELRVLHAIFFQRIVLLLHRASSFSSTFSINWITKLCRLRFNHKSFSPLLNSLFWICDQRSRNPPYTKFGGRFSKMSYWISCIEVLISDFRFVVSGLKNCMTKMGLFSPKFLFISLCYLKMSITLKKNIAYGTIRVLILKRKNNRRWVHR